MRTPTAAATTTAAATPTVPSPTDAHTPTPTSPRRKPGGPVTAILCLAAALSACAPPPPAAPIESPLERATNLQREGRFDEALKLLEPDSSPAASELKAKIHYDPNGPSLSETPPPNATATGLARAEQLCRAQHCAEAETLALIDAALNQRKPDDIATLIRAGRLLVATNRPRAAQCVDLALPLAQKLNTQNPLPIASLHWITATDELYADLLTANRHLGHARGLYLKAVTLYRHWPFPNAYTQRRQREIEPKIAALDRALFPK